MGSTVAAVDCSTAASPDQCQCGLDKCGDAINSCLADSACAASQDCALACACSDTACTLKCAHRAQAQRHFQLPAASTATAPALWFEVTALLCQDGPSVLKDMRPRQG